MTRTSLVILVSGMGLGMMLTGGLLVRYHGSVPSPEVLADLTDQVASPLPTPFAQELPLAQRIPPTPPPIARRMTTAEILAARDVLLVNSTRLIEIDVTNQIMTAWEYGKQIWTTPVSTGKASTLTKPGVWSVLDKYPMAYGQGYGSNGKLQNWKMPYWLGIYMVGTEENGIHELPFINGVKEGPQDLGRPVSHGCVRVSHEQAPILYDWAVIGMPVVIHY